MNNSISFKYIKLATALVFLLLGSICNHSMEYARYLTIGIGAIFFTTALASFGHCSYRGYPTKKIYTIARYIFAGFMAITASIALYSHIAGDGLSTISLYSTIVDCGLIAYVVMFNPSATSIGKKVLKVIGFFLLFLSINTLGRVIATAFDYRYYTVPEIQEEIKWPLFILVCILIAISIIFLSLGYKTQKVVKELSVTQE